MKQLKFRAFQEGRGWASAVTILGDGEVTVIWRDPMYKSAVFPTGMPIDFPNAQNDGWIVEQFTGCVDCGGTDIYEGDILRLNDLNQLPPTMRRETGDKTIGYVVFDSAMFCFGIKLKDVNELQARSLGMMPASVVEVIGNIHEHSELLEVVS